MPSLYLHNSLSIEPFKVGDIVEFIPFPHPDDLLTYLTNIGYGYNRALSLSKPDTKFIIKKGYPISDYVPVDIVNSPTDILLYLPKDIIKLVERPRLRESNHPLTKIFV